MTIYDVVQCAKPLLFDNHDPEFAYSFGGTCCLGSFRGKHFAIIPKHCVESRHINDYRVQYDMSRNPFLPIRTVHRVVHGETEDTDWADLRVIEFASERIQPEVLTRSHWLQMDLLSTQDLVLRSGDQLVFRGFPSDIQDVGLEHKRRVVTSDFLEEATYVGPSFMKLCHTIRFNDLSKIADLDGLSGTPLFPIKKTQSGSAIYFAGILLRATKESGVGHFLECSMLLAALNRLQIW